MKRAPFFLLLTLFATALGDEVPQPSEPLYEKRAKHDRNGIGKFFMGREIAHVMGHQVAGWLERPERQEEERTDLLVDSLGLKPGMKVADIGCGTGYLAGRMARRIVPEGVVYGVDIQPEMLELLVKKMREQKIENVKPVLGGEADPKLDSESCDLMIMVDVYHEFEFPYEMMRKMVPALKKGGRLVFVEFRAEDPTVPIKEVHKMAEAQVKKEMALHPELEWIETRKELPQQHIIIFPGSSIFEERRAFEYEEEINGQPSAADGYGGRSRFVWRKLSPAKWEDVWRERLGWLGQRLVMFVFAGRRSLRLEAHQLTRKEADLLVREFGGAVREERALTASDLEPKPRPPLRVRGKLLVVSTEKERTLALKRNPGTPLLLIPATVAFGTGEHATTATCLRMLADVSRELHGREWEALDLGTGSGILALAARRFGARRVEAGDWDATALRVAKENAVANDVRGIVFRRLNVLNWHPSRQWPVVTANLFSTILVTAAEQITASVEKGGWLILSGVLRTQEAEVIAAFERAGCRVERSARRGKWVTCLARRKM